MTKTAHSFSKRTILLLTLCLAAPLANGEWIVWGADRYGVAAYEVKKRDVDHLIFVFRSDDKSTQPSTYSRFVIKGFCDTDSAIASSLFMLEEESGVRDSDGKAIPKLARSYGIGRPLKEDTKEPMTKVFYAIGKTVCRDSKK